tara:strand:- start:828 stop:1142 length:315 start_codon:yes stop_codon:yes gene_type:complete
MKEFGDEEIKGFKRTGGEKKFKNRKLSKIEEDGSKTIAYTLEINGENKLHNWDGPALINKKQKKKEYYLNGIQYSFDIWNEILRSQEGLPWYKQSGNTVKTSRF